MLIELLFLNPIVYLMVAVSILFAFSVHEYAHAQAAYSLGDPTPKYFGRLTINPLAHFDPIFTTSIFIFGIGMGKPVPLNPLNFKNQRWGTFLVALAGPLSNFFLAFLAGLFIRFFGSLNLGLFYFLSIFTWINLVLATFNILPLPPLDGSHVFFAFLPNFFNEIKILLLFNPILSFILAIFFMEFFGFRLICQPLFHLLTGISRLFF